MTEKEMDFYGFTGDPKIDEPRKRYIYRIVGEDNFDVDYPLDYEPERGK